MPDSNPTYSQLAAKPRLEEVQSFVRQFAERSEGIDLQALVESLGIPTSGKGTSQWSRCVHARIEQLLEPDAHGARKHLRALLTQHLHSVVLDTASIEPTLGILQTLLSGPAAQTRSASNTVIDWRALAEAAYVCNRLNPNGYAQLSQYPREQCVALAARRLRERGYAIEQHDDRMGLSEEAHNRLVTKLEELVRTIGGLNVARRIFESLSSSYDAQLERYHVVRSIRFDRTPRLAIPFGYLLALASKHLRGDRYRSNHDARWAELLSLATDYAAMYDVQEYLPPIFRNPAPDELPELLTRAAMYDAIFAIPQIRAQDVLRILRGLFVKIPLDQVQAEGWTLASVIATVEHIYRIIGERKGPCVLDRRMLERKIPGVDHEVARRILDLVLAHSKDGPNSRFSRPTELTERGIDPLVGPGNNLFFRPLLHLDEKNFVVLDRSVAGPAFIEAVLAALRRHGDNQFQADIVGPGIEHVVRNALAEHGVSTWTGDYDVLGIHGECDLVVEAPEHLVFIESKAKPLTRDARAGSDVALTLSLAGSVLAAHEQAMGHEVQLRAHGSLGLLNRSDGVRHNLQWRAQRVDRVALALFDYGVFQDRSAVHLLLRSILPAHYAAVDPGVQRMFKGEFKKLGKTLDDLRKHVDLWHNLGLGKEDPFFGCWFISVPQLLMLLESVESTPEFIERLGIMRSMSFQTYDFYYEFQNSSKITASAKAKYG